MNRRKKVLIEAKKNANEHFAGSAKCGMRERMSGSSHSYNLKNIVQK